MMYSERAEQLSFKVAEATDGTVSYKAGWYCLLRSADDKLLPYWLAKLDID